MAKARDNRNTQARESKPGLFGLLFLPLRVVFLFSWYVVGSILISMLIEFCGMVTGYYDHTHAAGVLKQEFTYLGDNFAMTVFGKSAEQLGLEVVSWFQGWLVTPPAQSVPPAHAQSHLMFFERLWQDLFLNWPHYRNAFFYVVMITAIRCVIVVMSSVLVVLVGIVAAIDGLHLRELRKVTGGVEHASIYHHAKALLPKTVFFGPIIYLAWPEAINPNVILLPGISLYFLVVLVTFATYKKIL